MKVVIMQPSYLPWMTYLRRVLQADMFIILDHVELDRSSKTNFMNRAKILNGGKETWLTIGVDKKQTRIIKDLQPVSNKVHWSVEHKNMIQQAYRKHPHFAEVYPVIEKYLDEQLDKPFMYSVLESMFLLFKEVGIPHLLHRSSLMLDGLVPDKGSDLILQLCKLAGATSYISGKFGVDYLDIESFTKAGIEIEFDNWLPSPYEQHGAPDFVQGLSTLDVVMNQGFDIKRLME
jgi:hypothetical protein